MSEQEGAHVGDDPPRGSVPQPQHYEGGTPAVEPTPGEEPQVAGRSGRSGSSDLQKRVLAVAAPVAFVLFMAFGFAGGWAWSWLFLMIPGIAYTWVHATDGD